MSSLPDYETLSAEDPSLLGKTVLDLALTLTLSPSLSPSLSLSLSLGLSLRLSLSPTLTRSDQAAGEQCSGDAQRADSAYLV